jgi:hypothetical protein
VGAGELKSRSKMDRQRAWETGKLRMVAEGLGLYTGIAAAE